MAELKELNLEALADEELEDAVGGVDIGAVLGALEARKNDKLTDKMLIGVLRLLNGSGSREAAEKLMASTKKGGLHQVSDILGFFK